MVGTRKAGTTWLQRNFLSDPEIAVPVHVKETGFFAGRINRNEYDRLYRSSVGVRLEVDSSLATAPHVVDRVHSYDPQMRVALVLREPIDFAVSRYVHGCRKGDIDARGIVDAIRSDAVLRAELDYNEIVLRFGELAGTRVFRFESIRSDPVDYYSSIRRHLTDLPSVEDLWEPSPVNEARVAAVQGTTAWLARQATRARRVRMHRLVNLAKATRLHTLLERPMDGSDRRMLSEQAAEVMHDEFPLSFARYDEVSSCDS